MFAKLDKFLISEMRHWAAPVLRVALGVVFLWFGALKILDLSPVLDLVKETYSFMPYPAFFKFLGWWEVIIGLGLIFKIALRATLALLWLQMAGTLVAPILQPAMFFDGGNIFLLTIAGEFVVKNLVLIAAGLVVGGYEIRPK
jgi:uncharacterized membrane protein YkgB